MTAELKQQTELISVYDGYVKNDLTAILNYL